MKLYNRTNKLIRYLDRFPDEPNEKEKIIDHLMSRIEMQLNVATLQMARLSEGEAMMSHASDNYRPQSMEKKKPFIQYFADMEFFVNSVHRFFKLCDRLNKVLEGELTTLIAQSKHLSETFRKIRNGFEHIDERILSQDEFIREISMVANKVLETRYGNVTIKPETLETLYLIYEDIWKVIDRLYIEPLQEWHEALFGEYDKRLKENWDRLYPDHPRDTEKDC